MKLNTTLATLIASLVLTACGGGGGSSAPSAPVVPTSPTAPTSPATPTNPTSPTSPTTPANPVQVNATDPYTGQAASGTATTSVSGVVVSNVTAGAIVTAYAVQADGSNGAVVGIAAPTGADGKFTMQLTSVQAGMVRYVATGGTFVSEADGSKQANTSMELVAPFVTSDLNFFVITPATNIISHLVAYKAKAGASLTAAYTASVGSLLSLSVPNVILKDDPRGGINLLKTVPGSTDDTLHTYQDVLTAIEWFGVRYDLPSSAVVRVLTSYAEQGFPMNGVDGANNAINVGKWNGTTFDASLPRTLDELTAQRNADGTPVVTAAGVLIHDNVKGYISTDLIQYFYRASACTDDAAKSALFARYPNDATLFADANLKAGVCDYDIKQIAALKARVSTNLRSK